MLANSFVAVDVETANNHPTSICSIGAVKVVDGRIVDRFYRLVKPEPEYYFRYFTEHVHGISRVDTEDAPTWDVVWHDFENFCQGLPLVAHNKKFDEQCIRAACRCYCIDYPEPPFYCTLEMSRHLIPKGMIGSHSLPSLCQFFAIPFTNHHNALADADACAQIALCFCSNT